MGGTGHGALIDRREDAVRRPNQALAIAPPAAQPLTAAPGYGASNPHAASDVGDRGRAEGLMPHCSDGIGRLVTGCPSIFNNILIINIKNIAYNARRNAPVASCTGGAQGFS